MPLDGDSGFWKSVAGAISSAGVTMFGYHKYITGKIDTKADKEDIKRVLGHIEKLYGNAEQDRRTLHECVDKLSDQMHANHVELIKEVASKADR